MSTTDGPVVIYRDDALCVVNKPSGVLVHRGWAKDRHTLLDMTRDLAGRYVYPLHRLDRSASGVVVFALSSELARLGQQSMMAGLWQKDYFALVRGITQDAGRIDYPLAKDKAKPRRPAVTEFERIGQFERYSLLWVRPKTGRLHQIRRHFRHESHPLIGDVRYGKADQNRLFRERFDLHRLCLHAFRLSMPHPVTGEPLTLQAALPEDLVRPWDQMGLTEACRGLLSSGSGAC